MKWYKSKCVKTQAESSRRKSKDIHYSTGKRREGHCRPSDFLASICSFHKRHLGATKSSERSNKKLFPNPSTLDAGTESQPEYVSLCSMWVVENRNIPARILEVFLEWSLEAGKEQMDSCMQGLDFLKAYPYCLRQKTNFKATLNCLMVYFLYLLAYFTDNWNFDNNHIFAGGSTFPKTYIHTPRPWLFIAVCSFLMARDGKSLHIRSSMSAFDRQS